MLTASALGDRMLSARETRDLRNKLPLARSLAGTDCGSKTHDLLTVLFAEIVPVLELPVRAGS